MAQIVHFAVFCEILGFATQQNKNSAFEVVCTEPFALAGNIALQRVMTFKAGLC
jgi:hypothetical protein